MRLYHRHGSRSERVRWMLGELEAACELTVLTKTEQAAEAHRRRHPLARVPVLDDGEGPIFESEAICLQLADLHADAGLVPAAGSHDRGLVYQWAFFAMTELESPLADVSYATNAGDGRGGDVRYPRPGAEQVAAATARFRAAAQVVEHALGDDDYLVADRFGVADVLVGSVLAWADDVGLVGHDLPASARYLARLQARPAYRY